MNLKRTPLFEEHVALKARMVPFGGWEMPVQYSGVLAEHTAVRTKAGLFDISHMGEFRVKGAKAKDFLQSVTTNDLSVMSDGRCQYSILCYENGTVVDDIIVYRVSATEWILVVNASNIEKDFAWLKQHAPKDVDLTNESPEWGLLAVQGPNSVAIVDALLGQSCADLRYYHFKTLSWSGQNVILSRTGYTGEDGFEIFVPKNVVADAWRRLLEIGQPHGLIPVGLAARDTLRLEAAYSLYGHEINDTINPLEANLGWVVKIDKGDFIGRKAIMAAREEGLKRKLVGFELQESGIAREGYEVCDANGQRIGLVTSGTHSPSLKKSIGLALIDASHAVENGNIFVAIRDQKKKAAIVKTPFYRRKQK